MNQEIQNHSTLLTGHVSTPSLHLNHRRDVSEEEEELKKACQAMLPNTPLNYYSCYLGTKSKREKKAQTTLCKEHCHEKDDLCAHNCYFSQLDLTPDQVLARFKLTEIKRHCNQAEDRDLCNSELIGVTKEEFLSSLACSRNQCVLNTSYSDIIKCTLDCQSKLVGAVADRSVYDLFGSKAHCHPRSEQKEGGDVPEEDDDEEAGEDAAGSSNSGIASVGSSPLAMPSLILMLSVSLAYVFH